VICFEEGCGAARLLEEMNWICLRCGGVRAAQGMVGLLVAEGR
jgi:hypothetical protein